MKLKLKDGESPGNIKRILLRLFKKNKISYRYCLWKIVIYIKTFTIANSLYVYK